MTEKLTPEEELLDLQRAQFNLAKNVNRNLGCLTTAVVAMILLWIGWQVIMFLDVLASYGVR